MQDPLPDTLVERMRAQGGPTLMTAEESARVEPSRRRLRACIHAWDRETELVRRTVPRPRVRVAARRRRTVRSSARSGDSGDGAPGDEPPPPLAAVPATAALAVVARRSPNRTSKWGWRS
jgi:hypothetical protein